MIFRHSIGGSFGCSSSGVPWIALRKLIGITSTPSLAEREHHVEPVFPVFAHAEDPAAAQRQAGLLGDPQRVDALAEGVGGDDVGVMPLVTFRCCG